MSTWDEAEADFYSQVIPAFLGGSTVSFTDANDLLEFLKGKSASITVKSQRTGQHFSYQFKFPRDRGADSDVKFISYRSAAGKWLYMGNYKDGKFYMTRKSSGFMKGHPATQALEWLLQKIAETGAIPEGVEVSHEGKCSMCGRKLTDPHSLKMGIGPECATKRLRHPFLGATQSSAATGPKA